MAQWIAVRGKTYGMWIVTCTPFLWVYYHYIILYAIVVYWYKLVRWHKPLATNYWWTHYIECNMWEIRAVEYYHQCITIEFRKTSFVKTLLKSITVLPLLQQLHHVYKAIYNTAYLGTFLVLLLFEFLNLFLAFNLTEILDSVSQECQCSSPI